jgi:hypothetical protein
MLRTVLSSPPRGFWLIARLILFCAMYFCASAADDVVMKSKLERITLLELYTSEGCSSCPPAEKWLSALRSDARLWRDVVPVAFHVNYWDRLRWKDRFAQQSFTARQYAYAKAGTGASVYTPGFIVNGREWRGWFDGGPLPSSDDRVGALEARVTSAGAVTVRFSPERKFEQGAAYVTWLGFDLVSDVRRGENAGRVLRHDFVALQDVYAELSRETDGTWKARVDAARLSERAAALAVWVENAGIPVQATGGWFTRSPAK